MIIIWIAYLAAVLLAGITAGLLRICSPAKSSHQRYQRGQAAWLTAICLLVGLLVLIMLSFHHQANIPLS